MRGKYDDILNMPRPEMKHDRMPRKARAAQFSPFAALSGQEEAIRERERSTEPFRALDENEKAILDEKFSSLSSGDYFTVTYFEKDRKKDGGKYIKEVARLLKTDAEKMELVIQEGRRIPIQNIISISPLHTPLEP